jgi:hypothetical protein
MPNEIMPVPIGELNHAASGYATCAVVIPEPNTSEALRMAAQFTSVALDQRDEARRERDEALSESATKQTMIDMLSDRLQMRADQVTRLQAALAKFTDAHADSRPPLAHDPFRDFGHDPRRMGPI